MKEICLKGLNTSLRDNVFRVQADVSGIEPLWFEVSEEYRHLIDIESVDAFFLIYTWLAMEAGCDLRVDGKVSERLSKSVTDKVKTMFLVLCPRLKNITICVNNNFSDWSQENLGSFTGFSGGVDSWFTAINAAENNVPFQGYLFTNTGQHGEHNPQDVFCDRAKVAKEISHTLNQPFITVNSNMDCLFDERYQQRHSISNLACALLFQCGFSQYSYAATFAAKDSAVVPHRDIAIIDSFLLPLLSTERMTFVSCGDEAGRIEKLDYISKSQKFSGGLYVCIEKDMPVRNCGRCFKCRRTQIALDYLGLTEVLANSFNLEHFNSIKMLSMVGLMASSRTSTLDLEISRALDNKYGLKILHLRLLSQLWFVIKKVLPPSLKWRSMAKTPYLW